MKQGFQRLEQFCLAAAVVLTFLLPQVAARAGEVFYEQAFRRDVRLEAWAPTATVVGVSVTNGGSFAATGTWYFALQPQWDLGTAALGPVTNASVTATGQLVRLDWVRVGGATNVIVWRGSTATQLTQYAAAGTATNLTDTGTNAWSTGVVASATSTSAPRFYLAQDAIDAREPVTKAQAEALVADTNSVLAVNGAEGIVVTRTDRTVNVAAPVIVAQLQDVSQRVVVVEHEYMPRTNSAGTSLVSMSGTGITTVASGGGRSAFGSNQAGRLVVSGGGASFRGLVGAQTIVLSGDGSRFDGYGFFASEFYSGTTTISGAGSFWSGTVAGTNFLIGGGAGVIGRHYGRISINQGGAGSLIIGDSGAAEYCEVNGQGALILRGGTPVSNAYIHTLGDASISLGGAYISHPYSIVSDGHVSHGTGSVTMSSYWMGDINLVDYLRDAGSHTGALPAGVIGNAWTDLQTRGPWTNIIGQTLPTTNAVAGDVGYFNGSNWVRVQGGELVVGTSTNALRLGGLLAGDYLTLAGYQSLTNMRWVAAPTGATASGSAGQMAGGPKDATSAWSYVYIPNALGAGTGRWQRAEGSVAWP